MEVLSGIGISFRVIRDIVVMIPKSTNIANQETDMKHKLMVAAILVFCLGLVLRLETPTNSQTGRTPPDVIKLAPDAKLGAVTFNHMDHATKNRSADLKSTVACVDCH